MEIRKPSTTLLAPAGAGTMSEPAQSKADRVVRYPLVNCPITKENHDF